MKNFLFLILLFPFVTLHATQNTPSQESLQTLTQKVEQLQKELQAYKKEQQMNSDSMSDTINDLYDYTESVETMTLEDKLKFGLRFKVNNDNINKKYSDGTKVKTNNIWSSKLMLKMKANITDSMFFYGRLSMYNYWGNSAVHPYSMYNNMQGRAPASSVLFVERAYLNWFFFKDTNLPLALTIGRLPTSDGPSNQYRDNTTRKGTYSALLYDGAADGIVATANISQLVGVAKTYLRFGYAKGFQYTEQTMGVQNAFIGPSDNKLTDTNVYGIFLETSLPSVTNSQVQLSYSKMVDAIANPLDTNTTRNTNIGDIDLYGAMIELPNLKDSHLDIFTHVGLSVAYPSGDGYLNYGGLLSDAGDTSSKKGHAYWLGTRYGFGEDQHYKVGFEYNHGSKNWVNLTQGAFDIYNKLATRGDVYEVYAMYVINRYANLRLGYICLDYDYTGSGWFVGKPEQVSDTENALDKVDSIYLKMSVNF